jgi:hypothetical protein
MHIISIMHMYHITKCKKKKSLNINLIKIIFYLNYAHLLNLLLNFDIMNIIVVLAWSDHFANKKKRDFPKDFILKNTKFR